jgi:hypothetical protein
MGTLAAQSQLSTIVTVTDVDRASEAALAGVHSGDVLWVVATAEGVMTIRSNQDFSRALILCMPGCLVSVGHKDAQNSGFTAMGAIQKDFESLYRPGTQIVVGYKSRQTGHVFRGSGPHIDADEKLLWAAAFGSDNKRSVGAFYFTNSVGAVAIMSGDGQKFVQRVPY